MNCYNPANICWSWRRLQRNNFTSSKTFWRRLEDALKTFQDVLKTCLEDVLKTCLEDVLKTCLEDALKDFMETNKILTGDICILISGFNKPKCVSNKSVFHKSISDNSKANPKCIRNVDFESWNYCIPRRYRLLGQNTKQPLSNFKANKP